MKRIISIVIVILTLISCNNQKTKTGDGEQIKSDSIVSKVEQKQTQQEPEIKVDNAYIGMTIGDLKDTYKGSEFLEEPVYEYGIDGESKGLLVKKNNEKLFFVWTLQGENKIHGITILSDSIIIDDNVHVGMTLKSFVDKYPNATIQIDMIDNRYEFLNVPRLSYRPEFLTTDSTRVAEYDYEQPEPEFKTIVKPDSRIERISVN
jgi:hypothetical protein